MNSHSDEHAPSDYLTAMARTPSYLDEQSVHSLRHLLANRRRIQSHHAGQHQSALSGRGMEYRDHRHYVAGDDPRFIDWRVFGRTERYYIRQFDVESSANVVVILDESESMARAPGRRESKRDVARRLATTLAYLHLTHHDRVAALRVTTAPEVLMPPGMNPSAISAMLAAFEKRPVDKGTRLEAVIETVAHLMPGEQKQIILWTDLVSPRVSLQSLYHAARRMGAQVVIWHVLDPLEVQEGMRGEWTVEDPETGAEMVVDMSAIRETFHRLMQDYVRTESHAMGKAGIHYFQSRTDEAYIAALARFLQRFAEIPS